MSANSPAEVIRFASKEEGNHLVIIFRWARDPKKSLREGCDQVQKVLAGKGFGNFSTIESRIGTRAALMLAFDRPQDGGTWSCREYFVAEGMLHYALGFGTNNKDRMFELYDRMAKSLSSVQNEPRNAGRIAQPERATHGRQPFRSACIWSSAAAAACG